MADILLHQYDNSPFSEKVRVCLGIKGLAWAAVDQPVIMPKPDLVPLTGGYRRIPVMQIGAEIYCDSALIVDVLERHFPEPTLFPARDLGLGRALALWTDRSMFQATVAIVFGGLGNKVPEAFIKDREALTGRSFDTAAMRASLPHMTAQLRAQLALMEEQLEDNRRFMTGEAPGLADANVYYNLWFIRNAHPRAAAVIDGFPGVRAWEARVEALGHGERHALSPAAALEVARAATPSDQGIVDPADGLMRGAPVQAVADDYGRDPISGTLVALSARSITIRREHPALGAINVHLPRIGFVVTGL